MPTEDRTRTEDRNRRNDMDTLIQELEQSAKGEKAAQNQPQQPRRSSKILWMSLGGAALVIAAGTWAYLHFAGRVSTDDAQVDAHIAPIAAKIGGNISEIVVDDNQAVKAGQVLVRIDPRDLQAKVSQAR